MLLAFNKMDLPGARENAKRALAGSDIRRGMFISFPRSPGRGSDPCSTGCWPFAGGGRMSPEQRAGTPLREMVSSPRVRRVVVKLGSGTVTDPGAGLRMSTIRALAAQMTAALSADGVSFVVVTSGAIAAGGA